MATTVGAFGSATVRAGLGRLRILSIFIFTVNRFCMALLYRRAGRLQPKMAVPGARAVHGHFRALPLRAGGGLGVLRLFGLLLLPSLWLRRKPARGAPSRPISPHGEPNVPGARSAARKRRC